MNPQRGENAPCSVAIVGRTNVGKSTLFNQLTRSRAALVLDVPGMTRDRKVGRGRVGPAPYLVIDTGGLFEETSPVAAQTRAQAMAAVNEADRVLFVVDAQSGPVAADRDLAELLRPFSGKIVLVVNKVDAVDADIACAEFHEFGYGPPMPVAAMRGAGIDALAEHFLAGIEAPASIAEFPDAAGIRVAIAGRPNVGKSTLVNRLLGEERVIVGEEPGTTRDSIYVPLQRAGRHYVLIDTAGIRRRSRSGGAVEQYSVVATLQAIDSANVVALLLDARTGVTDQDAGLLGLILDSGRGLVIAVNKWDGLDVEARRTVRTALDRKLRFVDFAEICFISAKHGSGLSELFAAIDRAARSAQVEIPTGRVTQVLHDAVEAHQPPLVRGRRIKLRYAHLGGKNPPTFVVHGNQVRDVPAAYRRYLEGAFRNAFELVGTPVRIEFRQGGNPYA